MHRSMTVRSQFLKVLQQEDLNFLLTNRIPRRLLTRFMGWFSQIEQPLVRDLSIGAWRFFSDLDLGEAKKTQFKSMHDCFIRELRDGARPIDNDPAVLVSPCDAIVGACGAVEDTELIQAKGFSYTLHDLLCDPALVSLYRNGRYVTLRPTSSINHRFHAPQTAAWSRSPIRATPERQLIAPRASRSCSAEERAIVHQAGPRAATR